MIVFEMEEEKDIIIVFGMEAAEFFSKKRKSEQHKTQEIKSSLQPKRNNFCALSCYACSCFCIFSSIPNNSKYPFLCCEILQFFTIRSILFLPFFSFLYFTFLCFEQAVSTYKAKDIIYSYMTSSVVLLVQVMYFSQTFGSIQSSNA